MADCRLASEVRRRKPDSLNRDVHDCNWHRPDELTANSWLSFVRKSLSSRIEGDRWLHTATDGCETVWPIPTQLNWLRFHFKLGTCSMTDQSPVGIDLGTTFSAVAHLDSDGRPLTILNGEGDLTTPSVVFFDEAGAVVGKEALAAGEYEPERLAQFAKRDMGEQAFSKSIRDQELPAEVVQAVILRKLKEDAELKLQNVSKVVVTVPAFFNEPCRRATQDAGRLAGLDVIDIINEPTAAAICYGVQKGFLTQEGASKDHEMILIYDLGGGTFDVTVMEIDGTNYKAIATAGDVYLGGVDWDERLVDHMAEAFIAEHGIDPREDEVGKQALMLKAAEVKHSLSSRMKVPAFFNHAGKRLKAGNHARDFRRTNERPA